jgi:iron complex outermembrane receptor protein
MRGMTGGRTLILIDDGRVTAERRAGASATFLNPFILGSVEIARGPGAVAYGSDAFGGVIHARPRDPVPGAGQLRYELSAGAGGSALKSGGVEWSQGIGDGAILASVYARSSGETHAAHGREIDNSAYSDHGATIRYVRSLPSNVFRIGLSIDRGHDIGAPAADSLAQRTWYPEEDSTRLTASWDGLHIAGFEHMEVRAAAAQYSIATNRERFASADVTRQISNATVDSDDAALRVTGFRPLGRARLSTGIDLNGRFNLHADGFVQRFNADNTTGARTDEVSIDDARRTNAAAFATLDVPVSERVSASVGLRGDRIASQNRGGWFGDRSRSEGALSGHAAMSAAIGSNFKATLQASRGFREPSLSDRYFRGISGRGFVIGNPDLDPETSRQYDGSLRWQRERSAVALYAYHYSITDLVERYRAGADFAFRNRGEALVRGAELEVTVPLTTTLTLHANGAVARGEAVDDRAALDDIAAPNAHLALRWAEGRSYAFAHAFFFGEDDRPGPVETTRPAYRTMDLGTGWRFNERVELRLHARNVFDAEYAGSADANAALAPGRSVTLFIGGVVSR